MWIIHRTAVSIWFSTQTENTLLCRLQNGFKQPNHGVETFSQVLSYNMENLRRVYLDGVPSYEPPIYRYGNVIWVLDGSFLRTKTPLVTTVDMAGAIPD
jgi:hypothetical protein